jgi:hypothetical protein
MRENAAMTIMRYAVPVTLIVAALCAMMSGSAGSGQSYLVDAGAGAPQDFFLWVLAGIALISTLSLYRFVAFGIPTLLAGWYASNKQWLYALLFVALIWCALVWM